MWWMGSMLTLPLQKLFKIMFGHPKHRCYINDIGNKGYDEKNRF
jgi:hypothetical protein